MQQKEQFFTKLISLKNTILSVAVSVFIGYAVIGSIAILANKEALADSAKIIGPLMIFAIAIFIAVDNFHKLKNDNNIVKYLAISSLILGPICVLLLSLMIWEVIPFYESVSSSRYMSMSYYSTGPTVIAKLIFSLTYLTIFAFLGSNALAIKDNNKIVHFMRFATFIFLAFAVIINIISIFSSSSDIYGYLRLIALSGITWISCVGLGCITFFMSKINSWEEKEPIETTVSTPAPKVATAPITNISSTPVNTATDHVDTLGMSGDQKTESQGLSSEPQGNNNSEKTPEIKA